MTTRRDFLLALGAGALVPSVARADAGAAAPLTGIGLQLYTMRNVMRADPEGSIARIASLGYREIEWWGNWGRTPVQIRAMLDANGLTSPSAHIDPRDLTPERLPALLDIAEAVGHRTLLVAWTPPSQRKSADDWKRLGALLTNAGRTAAARGIRTGYHNHDFEFVSLEGRTALDILLEESDPAVVDLEIDCYWAIKAGEDPIGLLRRHARRVTMLHLKDSSGPPDHAQRDVGSGVMEWRALLAVALSQRVTNVFVEHDEPPDAWATARAGREYLRTLGY